MHFGRMLGYMIFAGIIGFSYLGFKFGDPDKQNVAFIAFSIGQLIFAHALITRREP